MRIFVTGASGWIGSAVTAELLANGHDVLGLARSDSSAAKVAALGAEVHRGSLDDLGSLRSATEKSDGVVHLGYDHDFSQMERAADLNAEALELFGSTLGAGAPLVIASGVAGFSLGRPATERDVADTSRHPRIAATRKALALSDRGVRSVEARFAPTVHGIGDHGFISVLVGVARERGVSGYIEEGSNKWSAVHRTDAARVVVKAVESAPPGTVLHAIGEEASGPAPSPRQSAADWACRSSPSLSTRWPSTSAGSGCSSGWTPRHPTTSPVSCSTGSRPTQPCSRTSTVPPTSRPRPDVGSLPGPRTQAKATSSVFTTAVVRPGADVKLQ